ncbi:MAG: hypothetical protein LBI62_08540 [Candidatus Accumulibacter sp.]|nr:hypothetical protein [Accumulibacter sp.]
MRAPCAKKGDYSHSRQKRQSRQKSEESKRQGSGIRDQGSGIRDQGSEILGRFAPGKDAKPCDPQHSRGDRLRRKGRR